MFFDAQKIAAQKYCHKLLGDARYPKYHELMQRISSQIITQKDALDFATMLAEIYEVGFLKAVEDYKKEVEKHGFKIEFKEKQ